MVGADADIGIWDPSRRVTITQDLMLHGSDYTPYEGLEVVGWPIKALLRGNVIAEGGAVVGHAGDGKFLKRTIAQPF